MPDPVASGDVAERIVLEELLAHDWVVQLMPKNHPNFDIDVSKGRLKHRIQVKGKFQEGLDWIELGRCYPDTLAGGPIYNRVKNVPPADFVICVSYRDPQSYRCFIFPIRKADKIARDHANLYYGVPSRRTGKPRKPGPMQTFTGPGPHRYGSSPNQIKDVGPFEDRWELLEATGLK